jgi:hypothetical protein
VTVTENCPAVPEVDSHRRVDRCDLMPRALGTSR